MVQLVFIAQQYARGLMVQLVFIAQQYARALGRWGASSGECAQKWARFLKPTQRPHNARVVSSTPIIRCDNPSDDTLAKRVS